MTDDLSLLKRFADESDQAAFGELVGRYLGRVYGVAFRRTGDRQLAEEIAQEVFSALAVKASGVKAPCTLAGWLHRATVLQSTYRLRTESRRRRKMDHYSKDPTASHTSEPEPSPDSLRLVDEAIDALEPNDRKLVLLRFFEDLNIREMAGQLGLPRSTVHRQLENALARLSGKLRRLGVAVPVATLSTLFLSAQYGKATPVSLSAAAVTQKAVEAAAAPSTLVGKLTILTLMAKVPLIVTTSLALALLAGTKGYQLGQSKAKTALVGVSPSKPSTPLTLMRARSSSEPGALSEDEIATLTIHQVLARLLRIIRSEAVDPEDGSVQELLQRIGAETMPQALAFHAGLTDSQERTVLGMYLLMRWCEWDAAAAAGAALRLAQEGDRDSYATVVASHWAKQSPQEALAWQQGLATGRRLSKRGERQMLREIFKTWSQKDRETAHQALMDLSYDEQKAAVWGLVSNSSDAQQLLDTLKEQQP